MVGVAGALDGERSGDGRESVMSLSWARPELLFWILIVPVVIILPPLLLRRRLRLIAARPALRAAILTLLVVALAGPMMLRTGAESTTLFLVDRSGSVQDGSSDAAQQWMQDAIDTAGPDDAVMISDFGGGVERRVGPVPAGSAGTGPQIDEELIDPTSTNIEAALTHAGSLPVGGARVVLLSDGAETTGHAQAEVDALVDAGIPVDVIPLPGVPAGELRISGLSGPSVTWAGGDEKVTAYVDADRAGTVEVELSVDGDVSEMSTVTLGDGGAGVSFDLPALDPGFHVVEVRLGEGDIPDPVAENDSWPLGIVVREAPSVAIVTPEGGDSGALQQALEQQGFRPELVPSPALPSSLDELNAWDAIVLNNVPAWDLETSTQEALVAYARNGGGVVVLGGTASFGPGAYAATPLESMLPVTVKVTDGRDRPRVAVLLVIDRSGSMSYGESTSGAPKMDLAVDGVMTAASALVEGDQVGVIAFNDEPAWALPMTTLTGEDSESLIADSLGELHPDGGTELFPALQVGVDALRNVDADVRHIIVLSDGRSRGAERESYFRLLEDAGADGITVSTLGLGYDADTDLLEDLASAGGGRYHFIADASEIPRVTFEEARAAGSQSVLRGEFSPVQLVPSPIMADVEIGSVPALEGYNFAGARPGAQVVLASDRRDPLLVKWQFGLGRVVAWTGDSGADFAASWATWGGYDRFWGNTVSWALPDPANQQYAVSVTCEGDRAVFTVEDAIDASPTAPSATITIRDQDGSVVAGPEPLAGNDGSIAIPTDTGPAWEVEVEDGTVAERHAVSMAAGAEWQPVPGSNHLLHSIAAQTDGRVLTLDDEPASVFEVDSAGRGRQEAISVWWVPASLALVLFLVDIAVRLGVTFRHN